MSIPDPEDPMVWSCVTVVETLVHRPGLHNLSNWGTHLSDLLMIIRYNSDLTTDHHYPVGTLQVLSLVVWFRSIPSIPCLLLRRPPARQGTYKEKRKKGKKRGTDLT